MLRRNSLYTCLRHYPGGTVGCARCSLFPTTAAFPDPWAGRLPHYLFRGLLSVHSRFGPHTRQVALRPSTPEASEMSLPTSPLRLLPTAATFVGWDSHPLKFRAFSRRTMDIQDEQDKTKRTGQGRWKLSGLVAQNRRPSGDADSGGIRRSKATNMDIQDEQDKTQRTG